MRGIEQLSVVRAVRSGLIRIIPVLTIGAFALILQTFPIDAYQRFIGNFAGGFLLDIFKLVYSGTFGVLAVYMTYSISYSFITMDHDPDIVVGGGIIASVISFFILAGAYLDGFGTGQMGPKSMFLALLSGLGASALYLAFSKRFRRRYLLSSGADSEFNRMLSTLSPIACTVLAVALFNNIIMLVFRVDSFHMLLANVFNTLFSYIGNGFFKGLFFVLFSSVLWFFGIHGSDTLEGVMETTFTPGLAANQAALAAGGVPENILTKQFFDCFVLMGGCGATICLLIAILIFSRRRATRGLGLAAALPMIFNINEVMVFGLPIIFNPVMLVPFLSVPLVCYSLAYLATSLGLVPVITNSIEWTTPILLGGYGATGSLAGSAMQLVNVIIGVLIYMPFVRKLDVKSDLIARMHYDEFMNYFKSNEHSLGAVRLIDMNGMNGDFAKSLCADIRHSLEDNMRFAYQPQYRYDGSCLGVEALLRWKHPVYGVLYPPLVVKLAEEGGFLADMEEKGFQLMLAERPAVCERFGEGIKISFNVTGTTVVSPRFLQFCAQMNERYAFAGRNLCIEVTEQAAISFNEDTISALRSLKDMGLMLAIDDFSMGHTSINYLKDTLFDMIKIDGSLVKGLTAHQNCREIVSSITGLSATLGLTVLAEYVETEEERDILHGIGCDCYQGYLYSPAVFINEK